jgi:hypothetical protein
MRLLKNHYIKKQYDKEEQGGIHHYSPISRNELSTFFK